MTSKFQWGTRANYGSLASATSRTLPSPGRLLRRLTALNRLQLYRHQHGRKDQMNYCPDAKIPSSALSAGLIVVHRAKVCLHKMIFDHQSCSKTLRWFNKFRKKWLHIFPLVFGRFFLPTFIVECRNWQILSLQILRGGERGLLFYLYWLDDLYPLYFNCVSTVFQL